MVLRRLKSGEDIFSTLDHCTQGEEKFDRKGSSTSCESDDSQSQSDEDFYDKKVEIEGTSFCPLELGAAEILVGMSTDASEVSSSVDEEDSVYDQCYLIEV